MTKITIPGAGKGRGFSGRRVGLMFDDGVAITEKELNEGQRFFFERKGYTVEGDGARSESSKAESSKESAKSAGKPKGGE